MEPRKRVSAATIVLALLAGVMPHTVLAASPATLAPTGDGTRDATVQVRGVSLAYDAIDEGVATADTTSYLQNQQGSGGRYFAQLTDMPSDFGSMQAMSISIRARTVGLADDRTTLFGQVFAADETTALSGEVAIATNPGPSNWATVAGVALPAPVAGSKAIWDGARLRLRWSYAPVGSADSTQLRLTAVELQATYGPGGPPPPGDTTAPSLVSASVNASTLTMSYDEPLDLASVPPASAFSVAVASSPRGVNAVNVTGSSVVLTLSAAVTAGQTVTVSYGPPATGPVQDVAGNDAAAFGARSVTNVTPGGGGGGGGGTLPTLLPNGDGSRDAAIQVRGTTQAFDAINEGVAAADTSTYLRNATRATGRAAVLLSDMPGDFAAMVALTLSVRVRTSGVSNDQTSLYAQIVAADETSPLSGEVLVGTNPGRTSWATVANVALTSVTPGSRSTWDGARLRLRWAFTQVGSADSTYLRVSAAEIRGTYSSSPPPPDTTAPQLSAATVNGATLRLTYDETLDPGSMPGPSDFAVSVGGSARSVSAVSISGPTVSLTLAPGVATGDDVAVSYVPPATGPIQDVAGNDAAAFSGRVATNTTPPPGGAVDTSGNEITDAVRALGREGDGRAADSSFGIWEAATNLDPNGGFEDGSVGGWSVTGGTLAGSSEQAKFGTRSGKLVTAGPGAFIEKSVGGLSASTTYSRSLWVHRTETGATLTLAVRNAAGTGNLASAIVPASLGWHRVILRPRTESGQTSLTTRLSADAAGVTLYIDGAQLERNVVATPYVETSGTPATRGPSKVSISGTPVGPSQGWVAVRIRMGWDSTAPFSPDPGILDMSVSNDDALFCYWDESSHTFHLERHRGGSGTTGASSVQTFSAGTLKTVIFAWTATQVRISVDGGAFVSTGNTTIPGQATLYIGSDQVQGNGSNRQADSDYLWVVGGSGTLTDADAATIHGFGDTDHPQADLPGTGTFAWAAD